MKDKHLILLLVLSPLVSSCVQPAGLESGERAVVVNCILSYPSPVQTLSLSYSVPNNKNEGLAIDDAEVRLYDKTEGTLVGTFNSLGKGNWQADVSVKPGHQYELEIDVEGEERVSAVTTVPEMKTLPYLPNGIMHYVPHFESSQKIWGLGSTQYDVFVFDTPLWGYIINYDSDKNGYTIAESIVPLCSNVDGFNAIGKIEFFDNPLWEKRVFEFAKIYYDKYIRMDPTMPKRSVLFLASDSIHQPFYSSFSDPSVPLPTIENPVLLYAEPSLAPTEKVGYIVLLSVSDDYDRYLKEIIIRKQKEDGEDFTVIYDRTQLFTNIDGGVGIFGAKLTYHLPWDKPVDVE